MSGTSEFIKTHLLKVLRYRNEYWRKRHTVNRIRLGDDCTKYFHVMATISYRANVITQIIDDVGNAITNHAFNATLIWSAFKKRMGVSLEPNMQFDLSDLITPQDLDCLESPYTHEEIDSVIKQMPLDKAMVLMVLMGFSLRNVGPSSNKIFMLSVRIFTMEPLT